MDNQIYCKPYRFNIDAGTCKLRLASIEKEYSHSGLSGLTSEQKKCRQCQGKNTGSFKKPVNHVPLSELVCVGCGKKGSEVARFYPKKKKCRTCYMKQWERRRRTGAV
jgi:hypothetical protein